MHAQAVLYWHNSITGTGRYYGMSEPGVAAGRGRERAGFWNPMDSSRIWIHDVIGRHGGCCPSMEGNTLYFLSLSLSQESHHTLQLLRLHAAACTSARTGALPVQARQGLSLFFGYFEVDNLKGSAVPIRKIPSLRSKIF